jgi:hypothetical protein
MADESVVFKIAGKAEKGEGAQVWVCAERKKVRIIGKPIRIPLGKELEIVGAKCKS